jgi:hypothetical protein
VLAPIEARAISQTAFEAWGRPLIPSRTRAGGANRRDESLPPPLMDVLEDKVPKEGGFPRAGLAD